MTKTIVKRCLFCGRVLQPKRAKHSGKTDEHIIAKWLMDYLGIRRLLITPMRVETATRRVIDGRGRCNIGWMSSLEIEAKPLLTRLIENPHQLTELTGPERMTVARWTMKTAAAFNRASTHGSLTDQDARPVPDEHLRQIAGGSVPQHVAVVGGGYVSQKPFDWVQFSTWRDRELSYKISFGFRDLLLAVAYYPAPQYSYGAIQGHHIPLWEGCRGVILWPTSMDDSPPRSNSPLIEGFLRNIFLVSDTWLALIGNMATTRLIVPTSQR